MRLAATLLVILSLAACGPPGAAPRYGESSRAIKFGELVTPGEFPAVGTVSRFDDEGLMRGFCSSTLIAPDVVLTAAHCVPAPSSGLAVHFSRELVAPFTDDFSNPLWTRARAWRMHPEYGTASQGRLRNDVALVFLEAAVEAVTPDAVADEAIASQLVVGAPATIVGYGRDQTGLTGVLHKAATTLTWVGPVELRFGGANPHASRCSGDSGGPSFMEFDDGRLPRRRVVGVNSYGLVDCDSASNEARVDAHLAWIVATMRSACSDGTRDADTCAASALPRLATAPGPADGGSDPAPALDDGPDAGAVDLPYEPWSGGCASTSAGVPALLAWGWRRGRGRRRLGGTQPTRSAPNA